MKLKLSHFNSGLNENVRPDLLADDELEVMLNCYQKQPGLIISDYLPADWTEFNYLNLVEPHHFFIWKSLKNVSLNNNDWFILCISQNKLNILYQKSNNLFSKIVFDELIYQPSYAILHDKVFIADNNLKCIYTLSVNTDEDKLDFLPYQMNQPSQILQVSPAGADNEFISKDDSDIGMGIPRGSILQYCYTIVDKNGLESNPSPVTSYDVLNYIDPDQIWRKTKLTFPALPVNAKYFKLYRRDNLYSESKAFSAFSFVSKVYSQTFFDVFPAVEYIEPAYDHDFNVRGNQLAVSNNRLFIANASRSDMFPHNFDQYIKIDITNNNNKNYINCWIKVLDLTQNLPLQVFLNNESNYNKIRFYDTDRITPLKCMRHEFDIYVCIPYFQVGLSHSIFIAWGEFVSLSGDNFDYGRLINFDFTKISQNVKNENVLYNWDGNPNMPIFRNKANIKKSLFWGAESIITQNIVKHRYINSSHLYYTDNFYKPDVPYTSSIVSDQLDAKIKKGYICLEFQINNSGVEDIASFKIMNKAVYNNQGELVTNDLYANILNIKCNPDNHKLIINDIALDYSPAADYYHLIYSYQITDYSCHFKAILLYDKYIDATSFNWEYMTIENDFNIKTDNDFSFDNAFFSKIQLYNHSFANLYYETDIYYNSDNQLKHLLNNLPVFKDADPSIFLNNVKSLTGSKDNYLIYSDESGSYFPEENTVKIPFPVQKIIPDSNYKDNRINSIYLFTNFNIFHYELVEGTNQAFNLITDKMRNYKYDPNAIIQLDNQIIYIDNFGLRVLGSDYLTSKLNKDRFKNLFLLAFDPSQNRIAMFDKGANQMIFFDLSTHQFTVSDSFAGLKEMLCLNDKLLCVYNDKVKLFPGSQKASPVLKTKSFISNSKFRIARIKVNGVKRSESVVLPKLDYTSRSLNKSFNKWFSPGAPNATKLFSVEVRDFETLESIEIDLSERGQNV